MTPFSEHGERKVYREDYVTARLTADEFERYNELEPSDREAVCYLMTGGASFEKAMSVLPQYNAEP